MSQTNGLALRKVTISGFKPLLDFTVSFPDKLLLLIGPNGAGKSSVLQALSFVRYFAEGQPKQFFDDRNWIISNVLSQFARKSTSIKFEILLERSDGDRVEWSFGWGLRTGTNQSERLTLIKPSSEADREVFEYRVKERKIQLNGASVKGLRLDGSALSILDSTALENSADAKWFEDVRNWAAGILSLELLSPISMRGGARGSPGHIGARGQQLAGFLASLPTQSKDRIVKRLRLFYPKLKELDH